MKNMNSNKNSNTKGPKTYLSVSAPREYTDKNGEVKTSWKNCGTAFQGEKGMTVILDTLPLSGKLFIQEVEVREQQ